MFTTVLGSGVPQAAGYRDAFRGTACHTWNAEGVVESRVHLLLACRCDGSVDRRRRRRRGPGRFGPPSPQAPGSGSSVD